MGEAVLCLSLTEKSEKSEMSDVKERERIWEVEEQKILAKNQRRSEP